MLAKQVEAFLHAYYDCDAQRTGAQLMKDISRFLTPEAKKRLAPTGGAEQPPGTYQYQSRVTVGTTYIKTMAEGRVAALTVCTVEVTAAYGSTSSTMQPAG